MENQFAAHKSDIVLLTPHGHQRQCRTILKCLTTHFPIHLVTIPHLGCSTRAHINWKMLHGLLVLYACKCPFVTVCVRAPLLHPPRNIPHWECSIQVDIKWKMLALTASDHVCVCAPLWPVCHARAFIFPYILFYKAKFSNVIELWSHLKNQSLT